MVARIPGTTANAGKSGASSNCSSTHCARYACRIIGSQQHKSQTMSRHIKSITICSLTDLSNLCASTAITTLSNALKHAATVTQWMWMADQSIRTIRVIASNKVAGGHFLFKIFRFRKAVRGVLLNKL